MPFKRPCTIIEYVGILTFIRGFADDKMVYRKVGQMGIRRFLLVQFFFFCLTFVAGSLAQSGEISEHLKDQFFRIQVVDEQTGRGVPMVKISTTNNLPFITDSNGIAAIYEPGLMNQKVLPKMREILGNPNLTCFHCHQTK